MQLEFRAQERTCAEVDGKNVFLRDHVSLRTVGQWDACLRDLGFSLVDFSCGSSFYGGGRIWDTEWALSGKFLLEGVRDALPPRWVRAASDQLIALYRRAP